MQNFPNQGSNLCPLQWKLRVLTTGPPLLPFLIPLTSISYPAATWRLCHLTKTPVSNHFLFQTLLTPVRWSLHSLPYKTFALVTLSNCPAIPQHSGFPGGSAVKDPPAMQELQETWVWSLCQEDPLQEGMAIHASYSCLENPMDRAAWRATVHGVANSLTPVKQFSVHAWMYFAL